MASHQPGPPGAHKIALTNVRVFDGSGLVPGRTVVIEGGLIGADPAGAETINGDGGVLLPGDPTVDITAVRQVRGVWIGGLRVG